MYRLPCPERRSENRLACRLLRALLQWTYFGSLFVSEGLVLHVGGILKGRGVNVETLHPPGCEPQTVNS